MHVRKIIHDFTPLTLGGPKFFEVDNIRGGGGGGGGDVWVF